MPTDLEKVQSERHTQREHVVQADVRSAIALELIADELHVISDRLGRLAHILNPTPSRSSGVR